MPLREAEPQFCRNQFRPTARRTREISLLVKVLLLVEALFDEAEPPAMPAIRSSTLF